MTRYGPGGRRERVELLLARLRLYRPARNLYQFLFNRSHRRERAEVRSFFRRFVPAGSLVFDVGANHGRLSETFLEVGASVVAVEPNPELAELIRRRYGHVLRVESLALGSRRGEATLHLGRDDSHSTLSDRWREDASTRDRWLDSISVTVSTVDALIETYGVPHLLKLDVEGFEADVLRGLSQPLSVVVFEFQCAALDVAAAAVARLVELGPYRFNYSEGELNALRESDWVSADVLLADLDALAERNPTGYGDVFARLPTSAVRESL